MIGVPLNKEPAAYCAAIKDAAAIDTLNIVRRYGLAGKTILSIGSGYGIEEDLFAQHGAIVIALEPDATSVDYHRSVQHLNVAIHNTSIQLFPLSFYDCIYTSSPSDWMYGYMPMPLAYLRALRHTDLFIARLYGGNFRTRVLKSRLFIWLLKKLTAWYGLPLSEYWITQDVKDKNVATMVCGGDPDDRFPITTERFGKPSTRLF